RLRATLLHWTERLPVVLKFLDLPGGHIPIGRLGQHFGARTQRFFLREVLAPHFLALREIVVSPSEEPIASGAEALPDGFSLTLRDRADRLPIRLKRFDLFGRLNPARRTTQRFGALAERGLAREILGTPLRVRGEVRLAARPDDVMRGFETLPEQLTLRSR